MHTIPEIKEMLAERAGELAYDLAPPAQGSFTDKGKYFTLNPFRADTTVGSFFIEISGARAGHWHDFALGSGGDMLDLIMAVNGVDLPRALREARAFLGLSTVNPADAARRRDLKKARDDKRRAAERDERARRARLGKLAHRIWLGGQERLRGTPVEHYLRDRRGIDLAALGRQPRSLRYVPDCLYVERDAQGRRTDRTFPAMVALVCDRSGTVVACHRHWLAINPADGQWDKAPVDRPKMALGSFGGAWIDLWTGTGPKGGKACGLRQAPHGTRVYVTEGIEDGLSAAMLLPDARHIAGISLSNLGALDLPPCVTEVVIIADQDEGEGARGALERAIAQHHVAGRSVRVWKNTHGGKDLNDALRAGLAAEQMAAAPVADPAPEGVE